MWKDRHPHIELRPYFLLVLEYMPLIEQFKKLLGINHYSVYKQFTNSPLEIPAVLDLKNKNGTEPKLSSIVFH